jgi:hypothetical protein
VDARNDYITWEICSSHRDLENTKPHEQKKFQRQARDTKTMKEIDFKKRLPRKQLMSGLKGEGTRTN